MIVSVPGLHRGRHPEHGEGEVLRVRSRVVGLVEGVGESSIKAHFSVITQFVNR